MTEETKTPEIIPITDKQFDDLKNIALQYDIYTFIGSLYHYKQNQLSKEQVDTLNEILSARKFQHIIKSGLNVFEVNGKQVVALNKENAERKASGIRVKRKSVPYSNKYTKKH